MGTSQRVTVTQVSDNIVTLKTSDGEQFKWPRKNSAGELLPVKSGDELVLTLTSSENLLTDLLQTHDTPRA